MSLKLFKCKYLDLDAVYNNNNVRFSVHANMQTCFHHFYKNVYNYCTLAIEMNGIPSFFPSIIDLLIKDLERN